MVRNRAAGVVALLILLVPIAPAHAGLADGQSALARGDHAAALRALQPAAEQGDATAQSLLGFMYLDGRGVPKDEQRGARLIQQAAQAGQANAQFLLGALYASGRAVRRSDEEAVRWYRSAAQQGHSAAQGRLGLMLARGLGVARNEEEAVAWWRKGAAQGDADSQGLLGIAYYDGAGVPKDAGQAYFWLVLAAGGHSESTFRYKRFVDRLDAQLTPQQRAQALEATRTWRPQRRMAAQPSIPDRPAPEKQSPVRGRLSTGSGILVAPDRVVTNHHVAKDCQRLRVGGAADGRVLGSDAQADLALIEWHSPAPMEPATVRLAAANIGEAATVVGFPLNGLLGFNVTTGNVSSLSGLRGDKRLLQISAPVQPGNSGGALLDAGGNVLGVVVSKLNALRVAQATGDVPQNVNFAIRAHTLATFLDAHGVAFKSTATTAVPMAAQEVARAAQAFTVLVECWR